MKMKRQHRVPLARAAIVILRELRVMTGQSEFVFPAVDSVLHPMSNNTLHAALRRPNDEVSVSDFRATASTLLNERSRRNPKAIERQLAHLEENDVRTAYMHAAEFWGERVEMMVVWADFLDQLRYGLQSSEGTRTISLFSRLKLRVRFSQGAPSVEVCFESIGFFWLDCPRDCEWDYIRLDSISQMFVTIRF
jgi:hypothetical protein